MSRTELILLLALPAGALAAAIWLTGRVRRYALRALLDVPGPRSSHATPTPRGGGLALAVVGSLMLASLIALAVVPVSTGLALGGAAASLAAIGWLDDHRNLSPWPRLVVQFAAVMPLLAVVGTTGSGGWLAFAAAALLLVWHVNLFNFMDGIDGIAALQVVACGTGAGLLAMAAGAAGTATLLFVLAALGAGFLYWNRHPARIFLGDVGSYYLGCMLPGSLLLLAQAAPAMLTAGGILLAPFAVDASATLLYRIATGARWYAAHRMHAYQRLVDLGLGQGSVALLYALLNIFLCWPLAWRAAVRPAQAWHCAAAACAVLLVLWAAVQLVFRRRNR